MNSYLIIGGTNQERFQKVKEIIRNLKLEVRNWTNHPDFLVIHPYLSIGIDQVRHLQMFLTRKPYQAKIKTVVISEAEKLTIPAQNAFLKTLEEPPENSLIILCSQNEEQLLPTIISRCQLIRLASKPQIELNDSFLTSHFSLLTSILKAGVGKRLKLIEPYTKSREEATKFCQEMLVVLKKLLSSHPQGVMPLTPRDAIPIIKSLQKTLHLLEINVNVKLALENLVISLPIK